MSAETSSGATTGARATGNPPRQAMTPGITLGARVRPWLLLATAVVVPIAVSLAALPIRGDVSAATVALGLAIIVSLVGAFGTRITAVIAAVTAALCFDILFTKPYGSFSISNANDVETAALLLIGGLIVGQLSARNRTNRGLVVQGSLDLGRIQGIAELIASGAGRDEVVAAVGVELQTLLGLRSCRFETTVPETPGPTIERSGAVSWGHFWWGIQTLGLPGKEISLIVENQQRRRGRYVLVAEPGTKVTREQLLAAVTLADQAGSALGLDPAAVSIDR
ncbi:MAG: DUF4118 domain-containing protein [Candidatus Dormiibacterota bacterium]